MARSALLLLLGALFFGACSAQTGYRVDAQQRFDGLPLEQFSRSVFLSSICNYFSLDQDLVRVVSLPRRTQLEILSGGSVLVAQPPPDLATRHFLL